MDDTDNAYYPPSNVSASTPGSLRSNAGSESDTQTFRPHAFALSFGNGGAKIAYGELHYGITVQTITKSEGSVTSITQNPIKGTQVIVPVIEGGGSLNPEVPNVFHQLDGYGEVYLYWEYTLGMGEIDVCEIRIGKPDEEEISMLSADLVRESGEMSGCTGKFAMLIGTVEQGGLIKQNVSDDVPWFAHIIQDENTCDEQSQSESESESESSSDSSSDDSSDSSDDSDDSGNSGGGSGGDSSSKDTCIVPVPKWFYTTGYAALFVMESPEVRFEDFVQIEITGRITRVPVDPKFVVVCEPGTLNVRSTQHRKPVTVGAWIGYDGHLYINAGAILWPMKKGKVNVSITGIRRGFATSSDPSDKSMDTRFAARDHDQFVENEEAVNSSYTKKRLCI